MDTPEETIKDYNLKEPTWSELLRIVRDIIQVIKDEQMLTEQIMDTMKDIYESVRLLN